MADKITITDHWLKPKYYPAIVITSDMAAPGAQIGDFVRHSRDIRLVGTKKQQNDYLTKRMDEDNWEIKDSWNFDREDNPEKFDELIKIYNDRGGKILHVNLILQ